MSRNPNRKPPANWSSATRDVTLRLIATGQLPIGIFGAVVILMLWKTPNEQMGKVWDVLDLFIRRNAGLGYFLSVVIAGGWFIHARFQRINAEAEVRRLSKIRTKEQQPFFKGALESSDVAQAREE
jgi:hypothetical protein